MKNINRYLKASGYAAFALLSLLMCLYLTFDYSQLKPFIKNQVEQATGARVEIGSLASYRLSGVAIQNLKLQFKEENPDKPPSPITIEKIYMRLKLLPLLIGRKSISFNALLAGGKMQGNLSTGSRSIRLRTQLANLMLERIPIGSFSSDDFKIGGKIQGLLRLNMPDPKNPALWKGQLDLELSSGKIYPFSYSGLEIPEIRYSSGQIKVIIEDGKANIDPLKMDSNDLPIDLKGNVDIRIPWQKSFVDISGTIKPSQKLMKTVPFMTSIFSSTQPFTYKGNLEAMLRTF